MSKLTHRKIGPYKRYPAETRDDFPEYTAPTTLAETEYGLESGCSSRGGQPCDEFHIGIRGKHDEVDGHGEVYQIEMSRQEAVSLVRMFVRYLNTKPHEKLSRNASFIEEERHE